LVSWVLLCPRERRPVFQPAVLCGGFEEVFKNISLSLSLTLVTPQTTYILPYDQYTKSSRQLVTLLIKEREVNGISSSIDGRRLFL
jgi:hypothetical protein